MPTTRRFTKIFLGADFLDADKILAQASRDRFDIPLDADEILGIAAEESRPQIPVAPADVTAVDPSFATADRTPFGLKDFDPRGEFGIIPEGATQFAIERQREGLSFLAGTFRPIGAAGGLQVTPESFEKEPFDPAASAFENSRALILNAARGLVELPVGLGTQALEDPISSAVELAAFVPDEIQNALVAMDLPQGGGFKSARGDIEFAPGPTRRPAEEVSAARERIFQSPEALALAALPFAKGAVGAARGRARPAGVLERAEDFRARAGVLPTEQQVRADVKPTVPIEATKQPFEMTRKEYDAAAPPTPRANLSNPDLILRKTHRTLVREALEDGKTPYEGFELDYPELGEWVRGGKKGPAPRPISRQNVRETERRTFEDKDKALAWMGNNRAPNRFFEFKESRDGRTFEVIVTETGPQLQAKPPVEVPEVKPPVTPPTAPPRVPTDLPDARVKQGLAEQPAQPVARQRPVVPVSEPPKAPPPKPIAKEPGEPGEIIGLNKAEISRIREETGLSQLKPEEQKPWIQSLGEAKSGKLDQSALETAESVIKSKRAVSDAEHAGMVLKAAELSNQYEASIELSSNLFKEGNIKEGRTERSHGETILDQLNRLETASQQAGRESGRALNIRKMMINRQDFSIARSMQQARIVKGGRLSQSESALIEQVTTEYKKRKAAETKLAEVEVENLRLIEENQAKRITAKAKQSAEGRAKTLVAKKRLGRQRESIKKDIRALGFRVNEITGVSAEGSFLIGKLAVNYIKEGAKTLEQVVRRVRSDLPEITERDVHRALIARNPRLQAKARTDVSRRVAQLKTQSRLLIDIEKAERGIFKKPGERSVQPFEIRRLSKVLTKLRSEAYRSGLDATRLEKAIDKINSLQDQLKNQFRPVRKRTLVETPELASAKGKIREIQQLMRTTDELARLNEQLRNNQFEVKKDLFPKKKISPELERAQVELSLARKDVQGAIASMAPVTFRKVAVEIADTFRTAKATADISGVARQGFIQGVTHPVLAGKSFNAAMKAAFSKHTAEQIDNFIRSADHHYIREKSGLYLSPIGEGVKLSLREEHFRGQLLQKIPVLGEIVKASERHMLTYLNTLRVQVFDQWLARNPNATHVELSAMADIINITTGRGNLGRASAIGSELGFIAFAPRFAVSRIQTPWVWAKYMKHPRVRKQIIRQMTSMAATGAAILGLAEMSGFLSGDDPRESDFGKIRIGNTRIDIWAGYQQPMRVLWRIGLSGTDRIGFTGKQLSDFEKQVDPVELFGRFLRYKLSPAVNIPIELLTGRTVVMEDVTPLQTASRVLLPIVVEEIQDAFKDAGFVRAAWVAPVAALGIGTSTFKDSESRVRRDIKKAIRDGNHAAAKAKQWEWNIENPGRQISDHIFAPPEPPEEDK